MRKHLFFGSLLMIGLLVLSGCSCNHVWKEADCLNPKTCSRCQETDGEPLGHTSGEWKDNVDMVTCAGTKEHYCASCNELISSEPVSLSTLVENDLFLFTPKEFMERLTLIAQQHSNHFTYEFIESSTGLQVLADVDGIQAIIQFFHSDTTALASNEIDASTVWCVSLITVEESDADFRQQFFMACDPKLDKDAAFALGIELRAAFLTAASRGEPYGFLLKNNLLYESGYIQEGALGQDYSMSMDNIYASDYRQANAG